MDNLYNILFLIASIGIFMLAVKITSDNMEKLANTKLRTMLDKVTGNRFLGVGIGTFVTGVIQSSAATTVMVIGLVNAGVMNLLQATYVVMGANIGTTVTAQIAALSSFGVTEFFMVFTFVGVFMEMLAKTEKVKTIGNVVMGLGMVFLGLYCMSNSMKFLRETPFFEEVITQLTNPMLLLLVGVIFTALIQSSSAVSGILVAMAAENIVIGSGNNEILFIILGSNIGTCITAILATIGSNTNGKRAAIIHLMFNVLGTTAFTIFLVLYKNFTADVLCGLFPGHPETQIAMFHTFFNVVTTLLLLPLAGTLVKVSTKLVKDKKSLKKDPYRLKYVDDKILTQPMVAVPMIIKEINRMTKKVGNALIMSVEDFVAGENINGEDIEDVQREVEFLNKKIIDYLIKLSSNDLSIKDEHIISSLYHVIIDVERIGDLVCNITRYTRQRQEENMVFSPAVADELSYILGLIKQQIEDVTTAFGLRDKSMLVKIERQEEVIDMTRKNYMEAHIDRLNKGECRPGNATLYANIINNLERAADHLNFIALSIENG